MKDCKILAEDLAAGEGGGHGDTKNAVEVEALAGEKEVFQRGAGGQDGAQRGSPIVTDAKSGALGS
mgnify:CR=1 FL=1